MAITATTTPPTSSNRSTSRVRPPRPDLRGPETVGIAGKFTVVTSSPAMINLFDCLSRYLSSDERTVQHAPCFEGWKSGALAPRKDQPRDSFLAPAARAQRSGARLEQARALANDANFVPVA